MCVCLFLLVGVRLCVFEDLRFFGNVCFYDRVLLCVGVCVYFCVFSMCCWCIVCVCLCLYIFVFGDVGV